MCQSTSQIVQPLMARASGPYQQFASFSFPELFGWTPSPVSLLGSKPVQQSTTTMGLSVVFFEAAHPGIALFNATTRSPHCGQLDGLMGMIWATCCRRSTTLTSTGITKHVPESSCSSCSPASSQPWSHTLPGFVPGSGCSKRRSCRDAS